MTNIYLVHHSSFFPFGTTTTTLNGHYTVQWIPEDSFISGAKSTSYATSHWTTLSSRESLYLLDGISSTVYWFCLGKPALLPEPAQGFHSFDQKVITMSKPSTRTREGTNLSFLSIDRSRTSRLFMRPAWLLGRTGVLKTSKRKPISCTLGSSVWINCLLTSLFGKEASTWETW